MHIIYEEFLNISFKNYLSFWFCVLTQDVFLKNAKQIFCSWNGTEIATDVSSLNIEWNEKKRKKHPVHHPTTVYYGQIGLKKNSQITAI